MFNASKCFFSDVKTNQNNFVEIHIYITIYYLSKQISFQLVTIWPNRGSNKCPIILPFCDELLRGICLHTYKIYVCARMIKQKKTIPTVLEVCLLGCLWTWSCLFGTTGEKMESFFSCKNGTAGIKNGGRGNFNCLYC